MTLVEKLRPHIGKLVHMDCKVNIHDTARRVSNIESISTTYVLLDANDYGPADFEGWASTHGFTGIARLPAYTNGEIDGVVACVRLTCGLGPVWLWIIESDLTVLGEVST
jgi:DNA-binding transcriptional LysR family regulator